MDNLLEKLNNNQAALALTVIYYALTFIVALITQHYFGDLAEQRGVIRAAWTAATLQCVFAALPSLWLFFRYLGILLDRAVRGAL